MADLCNRAGHYIFALWFLLDHIYLWPPYVIEQAIIFFSLWFLLSNYLLSFFIFSPNLSGRRVDVYHTSTHGVALVRI